MKILVTGARGFIGKNLIVELKNRGFMEIMEYNKKTGLGLLEQYTKECEFVFHLAGVNRPTDVKEFAETNIGLTSELLQLLKENNNYAPVVMTSSIQAEQDNPYGVSKKASEDLLFSYGKETGAKVFVYRLPNVFGKWSKPNYNSVVATFCHNIARDMDIQINQADAELTLCYIDDVVAEFIRDLEEVDLREGGFRYIANTYKITVGELANKLYSFKKNRETLKMPSLQHPLDKALYGTFSSYLKEDNFSYRLNKREDHRGWLAEFMKSDSMGQIFISKTKPGVTRGNHWHHTKVEKFLVIQGEALIRFRKIGSDEVLEYYVSGDIPEVVDIPAGYAHSIMNTGNEEVITLFWACEIFDPDKPDTYNLEV